MLFSLNQVSALAVIDSVSRMIDGVVGKREAVIKETLEVNHYIALTFNIIISDNWLAHALRRVAELRLARRRSLT